MITYIIKENDYKGFEQAMSVEIDKPLKHFERELLKIRTGRAHTSLIEDVMVVCYGGAPMPLKNVASISAPESRLLTVQPWDVAVINDIEKAIQLAELGLTPVNDGKIVRIQLPEMSGARREELVKVLGAKLEECKVSMRNVRKDFHNLIRDAEKAKTISKDFVSRLMDSLQKVTDLFIEKAENLSEKKEKDIRSV